MMLTHKQREQHMVAEPGQQGLEKGTTMPQHRLTS